MRTLFNSLSKKARWSCTFGGIVATVLLMCPTAVQAQIVQLDTLRLVDVRSDASRLDPIASQALLNEASALLRERNVRTTRLPQFYVSGQATWQNEVPELGFGNVSIDGPPKEQYRAQAEVDWQVYAGGRTRQELDVEAIRRAESLAGVDVSLHRLMDGASETFFAVLSYDAQIDVLKASVAALADRLEFLRIRVRDGAATEADAAALEAEWIRLQQNTEQAIALRSAALRVLGQFIGRDLAPETMLIVPDWSDRMATLADNETVAPELTELTLRQERLQAEADVIRSMKRPQVSFFGQAGLGRPGPFDFLSTDINTFALVGVRMRWSLMDWGKARRSRETVQNQAAIIGTVHASTERRISRELEDDKALEAHLARRSIEDARIVSLREKVLQSAQRQLEEGALLSAVYAERLAELTAARVDQQRNLIERSRAQYRILSALGALPGHTPLVESISNSSNQ